MKYNIPQNVREQMGFLANTEVEFFVSGDKVFLQKAENDARHRISGETQLIQVCWEMSDKKTFERELRGLKSAMDELSLSTGTIVTWDDETAIEDKIKVIPIWKWLIVSGDRGQTPYVIPDR